MNQLINPSKIISKISHSTLLQSSLLLGLLSAPANALNLTPIGTYATGIFADGAAEISAYDRVSKRLFVTNGSTSQIDVLDISNPTNPTPIFHITPTSGGGINSVAFQGGLLAVAVEAQNLQDPGTVQFFDSNGTFLSSLGVGALPDMVTFTPDGTKVLVANEGEPNDAYTNDPEGSVSIIDLSQGLPSATVHTADFSSFNGASLPASLRIFGPNASVAQDLEPEYIAVAADSSQAWVTLQENNGMGLLDLTTGEFTEIVGLGFKDHSEEGQGLDASDRDGIINISTYNNLFGMYQPDGIAAYSVGGQTYLVTANEGDSRDYDGFSEEERVKDLTLDPNAFPNRDELQEDELLGRLTVTTTLGDTDNDGDFDKLYAFGGRSFSIWNERGNLVFDSGDEFEKIVGDSFPDYFNSDNDENTFDTRSDNKGPEPEGIAIGEIGGRTYAFIGLERVGGVMTYDLSDPFSPVFTGYFNNRDFSGDPEQGTAGDLGPEGLLFIAASDSPNGKPLLVVTNEVSGTTTIYSVEGQTVPEPASAAAMLGLAIGLVSLRASQKAIDNRQ